jgi:glycosyltransferase involved in cell wall biosynthesis
MTQLVSVIVPVLDERSHIEALIDALLSQSLQPAEIIVADGGSTDGTREYLSARAAHEPLLTIVDGPGGISENRNAAISAARGEIIACTDAGCIPQPDWLEELTRPFASGARFVAGFFRPVGPTVAATSAGVAIMTVLEEVDPDHYLPAGNSQAFLKSAWERVGGFPEGMRAAEDTLFGERMRLWGFAPVFAPAALVHWLPPPTVVAMVRKSFRWGLEDGKALLRNGAYLNAFIAYWGLLALTVLLAVLHPIYAAIPIAITAALVGYRTRHKYRWVQGRLLKYVFVPVAHELQMTTQSLGWFLGMSRTRLWYLRKDLRERRTGEVLAELFHPIVNAGKRLVRPLIPDRVFLRLPRRSGSVRFNLDVVEPSRSARKRWVRATPDTVRALDPGSYPKGGPRCPIGDATLVPHAHDGVAAVSTRDLTEAETQSLFAPLSEPSTDVSMLAVTGPLAVGRTPALPAIEPVAVALREGALEELAPWPVAGDPLPVVYARSRAAGHRIALTRVPSSVPPAPRSDPIDHLGCVVILAVVPLHDVGGGSRSAQMAQELLARGYHVTYVSAFPVDETVDLGVRYLHPDLETYTIHDWRIHEWLPRVRSEVRIAILELPHRQILGAAERLAAFDFTIVYDLIDDWTDASLGAWGYDVETERRTIAASGVLVGSAPALVRRLEDLSGRSAVEIPNGVNTQLFVPGRRPPPSDLPAGDGPVFEYHGSLYGDWFDWESLARLAEAFPDSRILIIGDEKRHPPMPGNVHFLGLKPQYELPTYLTYTDVALIPWRIRDAIHAVHPLKISEYLAMGVPVAAPPMESLADLPGVATDVDLVSAVRRAMSAPKPDATQARRRYGWDTRMARLFEAAGLAFEEAPTAAPVRVVTRPVVHYQDSQRIVP